MTHQASLPQDDVSVGKARVDVEYIHWLKSQIRQINSLDLDNIEFYENDVKLDIKKDVKDEFGLTGLNNCDFITGNFYKGIDNQEQV